MRRVSPDPDQSLAAALRRLRIEQDLSQEDLGHIARVTAGSLSRIELGHANPSWTTVRNITAALGVSLVELAEAVEREESQELHS